MARAVKLQSFMLDTRGSPLKSCTSTILIEYFSGIPQYLHLTAEIAPH